MSKFKVGDRVRVTDDSSIFDGMIGEINSRYFYVWNDTYDGSVGDYSPKKRGFKYSWAVHIDREYKLTLISSSNMLSIKEKFITALLPEPEKSFRKAGITNGDGLLTEDGEKIFLTWLLNQNKTKFNDEVVQPLIKEEEEA